MPAWFAPVRRSLRVYGDGLFAGALALAWLTGVVSGGIPAGRWSQAVFVVCGLLITVPLAWRRRVPVLAASVTFGTALALAFLRPADLPIGVVVATLLMAYSLGAYVPGRRSWIAALAALAAVVVANLPHNDSGAAGIVLTPAVFVLVPWVVGGLVARLRGERTVLHRLNLALEREQQDIARISVIEERARIARELHDIVAHSISVMVVQAGAAEQFTDPASPARAPLAAIRGTGQDALAEMRRLLGVLRTDDPAQLTLAPPPGLDSVGTLVDTARRAGLEVTVTVHGEPARLASGLDVAAYRLVQESFSNIRKHARARTGELTLRYEPGRLIIEVADDGIGGRDPAGTAGHGVIGMRERVALYGGQLVCGPRPEGGWRVRAVLPLTG